MTTSQQKSQQTTPRFVSLRTNQAFAVAIAGTIATAKNRGRQVDVKENNFKAATSLRDYSGLERAAQRIMRSRGMKYTDKNYQAVIADIASGSLKDKELFRATIAFEGDATSIHTAARGLDQMQPEVPLFTLVEINDPSVAFNTSAWKKNERFTKLGAKMQIVAKAALPIVGQYLN